MRFLPVILSMALLPLMGGQAAAFEAGSDYRELDEPRETEVDDDRVEVREFFSYMCPHCHTFAPRIDDLMDSLGDSAELVHTPVVFSPGWEPPAQAYFTARALGATEETHIAFFDALHNEGRPIDDRDSAADVAAEAGVDRDAFVDAWDSFSVDADMRRAERDARAFGVRSTPSVGVAGRYMVDVNDAGGQERMIEIIRYLVEREADDGA